MRAWPGKRPAAALQSVLAGSDIRGTVVEIRVYISHAQENDDWLREKDAVGQDNPASLLAQWRSTFSAQAWSGTRRAVFSYDREKDVSRRRSEGWKKGVLAEIDRAHVAVLLVTQDYVASSPIRDTVFRRIRERHAAGELQLVPILVEPAAYAQLGIDESLLIPGKPTPLCELLAESETAGRNAHLEITQALGWALERASEKVKTVQTEVEPSPAPSRSELPASAPSTSEDEPPRRGPRRRWPLWAGMGAIALVLGTLPFVCGPSKSSHNRASAKSKAPPPRRPQPEAPASLPEAKPALADAAPPEVNRPFAADSGIKLVAGGAAFAVGFGPEGESVAALSSASRVELASWDLETRRPKNRCSLTYPGVRGGVFSPDGKAVAVTYAGARGKAKSGAAVVEVASCKEVQIFETSDEPRVVAYPTSGEDLYLAGRLFIERWGLDDGIRKARQDASDPAKLIVSGGRKVVLLLDGREPALAGWNVDFTRELWRHSEDSASPTLGLAASDNGKLVLAGHTGRVSVLETGSGRRVADLTCPSGALRAVAFSPDGSLVAAGGDDFALCLWNLDRRQLTATSKSARLDVRGIAFSPDGRRIAVAADHVFVFDVPR